MQIGTLAEGTKHKTKTAAERAAVRYLEDGYMVEMIRQTGGIWIVRAYYAR